MTTHNGFRPYIAMRHFTSFPPGEQIPLLLFWEKRPMFLEVMMDWRIRSGAQAPSCVLPLELLKWVSMLQSLSNRAALRSDEITELSWPVELHGFYKMLSHRDTGPSYVWKWVCLFLWVSDWLTASESSKIIYLRFTSGPKLYIGHQIFFLIALNAVRFINVTITYRAKMITMIK